MKLLLTIPILLSVCLTITQTCVTRPDANGLSTFHIENGDIYYRVLLGDISFESSNGLCLCYAEKIYHDLKATPPIGALMFLWLVTLTAAMITRAAMTGTAVNRILDNLTLITFAILASAFHNALIIQGGASMTLFYTTSVVATLMCVLLYIVYATADFGTLTGIGYMLFHFIYACYVGPITYCFGYLSAPDTEYSNLGTGCTNTVSVGCNKGLFWFALASIFPNEVKCEATTDDALCFLAVSFVAALVALSVYRISPTLQTVVLTAIALPTALLANHLTFDSQTMSGLVVSALQLAPVVSLTSGRWTPYILVLPLLSVFAYMDQYELYALYLVKTLSLFIMVSAIHPLLRSKNVHSWQTFVMLILSAAMLPVLDYPAEWIDDLNAIEHVIQRVHDHVYPPPTLFGNLNWFSSGQTKNHEHLYNHAMEFVTFIVYESIVLHMRIMDGMSTKLQCLKDFIIYLLTGINMQFAAAAFLLYMFRRCNHTKTTTMFLLFPIWFFHATTDSALMRLLPYSVVFTTTKASPMLVLYGLASIVWPNKEGTLVYCLLESVLYIYDHTMTPYIACFSPCYLVSLLRCMAAWTSETPVAEMLKDMVSPLRTRMLHDDITENDGHYRHNFAFESSQMLSFQASHPLFDSVRSVPLTPTIRANVVCLQNGTPATGAVISDVTPPTFRMALAKPHRNNLWCFRTTTFITFRTVVSMTTGYVATCLRAVYVPVVDLAYVLTLPIMVVLVFLNRTFNCVGLMALAFFTIMAGNGVNAFSFQTPSTPDMNAAVIGLVLFMIITSAFIVRDLKTMALFTLYIAPLLKLAFNQTYAVLRQLVIGYAGIYCTVAYRTNRDSLPTYAYIGTAYAVSTDNYGFIIDVLKWIVIMTIGSMVPRLIFARRTTFWGVLGCILSCALMLPKLGHDLPWQTHTIRLTTQTPTLYSLAMFTVYECLVVRTRSNTRLKITQAVKDIIMFTLVGCDASFILGLILTYVPIAYTRYSYILMPILSLQPNSALLRSAPFHCAEHATTQLSRGVIQFATMLSHSQQPLLIEMVEVMFHAVDDSMVPYLYTFNLSYMTGLIRLVLTHTRRGIRLTLHSVIDPAQVHVSAFDTDVYDSPMTSNHILLTSVHNVIMESSLLLDMGRRNPLVPNTRIVSDYTMTPHFPDSVSMWCFTSIARFRVFANRMLTNADLVGVVRVLPYYGRDLGHMLAYPALIILAIMTKVTSKCAMFFLIMLMYVVRTTEAKMVWDDVTPIRHDYTSMAMYVAFIAVVVALYLNHLIRTAMYRPVSSVCTILTMAATFLLPTYAPWPSMAVSATYNLISHYLGTEPGTDLIRTIGLTSFLHCTQFLVVKLVSDPLHTVTALYGMFDFIVAGGVFASVAGLTALVDVYTSGYFTPREVVVRDITTNKVVSRTYTDTLLGKLFFGDTLMIHANALRMCSSSMDSLINSDTLLKRWCASNDDNMATSAKILLQNACKLGMIDELLEGLEDQTGIPAVIYSGKSKGSVPFNALGVVHIEDKNLMQVPVANGALVSIRGCSYVLCNYHAVSVNGKPLPKIHFMSRNLFTSNKTGVPAFIKTHNPDTDIALYKIVCDKKMPHFKIGSLKLGHDHLWAGVNPPFTNIDDYFCVPTRPGPYGTTEYVGTPGDSGSFLINPTNGRLCGIKFATAINIKDGTQKFLPINYFLNLRQLNDRNMPAEFEIVSSAHLTSVPIEDMLAIEDHDLFLESFVSSGKDATSAFQLALKSQDPDAITQALRGLQKVITVGKARRNDVQAKRGVLKSAVRIKNMRNQDQTTDLQLQRNRLTTGIKLVQARIGMLGIDNPKIKELREQEANFATELLDVSKELRALIKAEHSRELMELTTEMNKLALEKAQLKAKMTPDEDGVEPARIAEYKQQHKELTEAIDVVVEKLTDYQDSFQALQTRMPGAIKAIRYPIVYNEGDQWVTVLSETVTVRTPGHPAVEQSVLAVGRDYGYNKTKLWRKVLQANTTTLQWAQEYIFGTAEQTSLVSYIRQYLWPENNIYEGNCPNCAKRFACTHQAGNHNCDSHCLNSVLNDINRHLRTCHANIASRETDTFVINNALFHYSGNNIELNGKWCKCDGCIKSPEWFNSQKSDPKFKTNRFITMYNVDGTPVCHIKIECYEQLLVKQIGEAKTCSAKHVTKETLSKPNTEPLSLAILERRMDDFSNIVVSTLQTHTNLIKQNAELIDEALAMQKIFDSRLQNRNRKDPDTSGDDKADSEGEWKKPKRRRNRRKQDLEWDTTDVPVYQPTSQPKPQRQAPNAHKPQQQHLSWSRPTDELRYRANAKATSSGSEDKPNRNSYPENVQVMLGLARHNDYTNGEECDCPFHRGCNKRNNVEHVCDTCEGFCLWCNDTFDSVKHVTLDCPEMKAKKPPCCGVPVEDWFSNLHKKDGEGNPAGSQCLGCDTTEQMCVVCFRYGHTGLACPLVIRKSLSVDWKAKQRDTPLYSNDAWLQSMTVAKEVRFGPQRMPERTTKPRVFLKARPEPEPEGV